MKVIIQRSLNSSVKINNKVVGQIDKGYVILVGFGSNDNLEIIDKMIKKIVNLRIFEDDNNKMNLDIKDVNGKVLSISQFTLYANLKGRRPSFTDALSYKEANDLYNIFNEKLRTEGLLVETGEFGADMKVSIENDGPVTIVIDSKDIL